MNVTIRLMQAEDYDALYALWLSCKGMGLNDVDDSREGIAKAALLVFAENESGNAFWEKLGFTTRDDVNYRNCALMEMTKINT